MELQEQFEQAVARSKMLSKKPDNDTLLKLYSLFKQAQVGDAPESGDYGMFDFVAKAKHEAWKQKKGMSATRAMQEYIDLIEQLSQSQTTE